MSSPAESPSSSLTDLVDSAPEASWRRALPLALGVLFLGSVLTGIGALYVDRLESARDAQDIEHAINRVTAALSERLDYYVAHMRAAAGLFSASDRVNLFEWERYVDTTELSPLNAMGAAGLVYAPRVEADRRADWEDFMFYAYDRAIPIRGSSSGVAFPVQFAAPRVTSLEVILGFDMVSHPTRRAAIVEAIERGDVVLSAPLVLKDAGDDSPGAILALPVYHPAAHLMKGAHSDEMVRGVVVLGLRYRDWLAAVSAGWSDKVRVDLFDLHQTQATPLVTTGAGTAVEDGRTRNLTVGGRQLQLVFHPVVQTGANLAGVTVRSAGIFLTLALTLLTFYLSSGRQRAMAAAAWASGALADSERRFALAASATSDGIWEWMPQRRSIYLSPRAQGLLQRGTQPAAPGLREILRCLPMAERRVLLLALRGHLRHRQPLEVAVSLPLDEGGARHLLVRGQAVWDALGRPTRVAGAISDVSLLRERELALDRARQFYARVLDFLPHPVMLKSEDHRYVLANRAAGEFLDRPPQAIIGARTEDLLPGQASAHTDEDRRVLDEGGVSSREFHLVLDNGNERDAIVNKVGVAGLDGQPVVLVTMTDVTTLRRTEQALRQSLVELDALFRNASLGMAMIKVNGTIVRANEAFSRIVGVPLAELPGMRYADLTPPRMQVLDREMTIDALRQGKVTPYERAFLRPDGSEVEVVLSGAVMLDAEGGAAIWTVVADISKRKAAERALAAAHATNASIVEAMPDMLVQFDEDLRLVGMRVPPGLRLAVDQASVVGQPLEAIVTPRRLAQVLPTLRLALSSGQLQCMEYRARDADGAMQDYEARAVPVSTGGLLVVLRNVSELKARERALRESEARFRLLAEAAPVVIWLADTSMNITYANRAWRTLTGLSLEETLDTRWLQVVHPDDVAPLKAAGRAARAAPAAYQMEFRVRRPAGPDAWLMIKGEPRVDDQGQVVGFVGVGVDISNEKQTREALRRHRDHLAELVTEKTASLIEAKEVAERANAAKSRFLANMSHELRSPMHAVLSYARLGEDKALQATPDKLKDYFQRIRTSGDRLLKLVDNLLDLSQLEAGRMVLDRQAFALPTVVAAEAEALDGLRVARDVRLSIDVDADVPPVDGDALRIAQVVRHLLSNAFKFSPAGGQVTVHIGHSEPAGVCLRVSDQGVGIPAEELETVFDAFVQSSATRTGAGGTGLGLALCREIVTAHGGRIRAGNLPGGGACFDIILPAAQLTEEPLQP
ncbi:PAS domain S-box protein [Denitromonas iodatirespirans]|uniref:histidine kinase n=1 Tax=Denitromonas iodatirespirans TaxID=2795389 RepID=A0A944DLK2_DENI1|nr:PAS domain S-box protein [Denitromonas iodatirespirans]MBT0960919.1 PAS domain S-box protein [Denitromonas iodatirespirans]